MAEFKNCYRKWAPTSASRSKLTAAQDTEGGAYSLGVGDFARSLRAGDGYRQLPKRSDTNHQKQIVRANLIYPETTRSGSMGGMPVAIATGRALKNLRLDATLDPPLRDEDVVMGGVRLTDPLEQDLLDHSKIQQLSVGDIRQITPTVWRQLDRLNAQVDKLYIHIDMDVLDPREVSMHVNKVQGGPSSEELALLLRQIFARYPKATAVGFATIPASDPGGLSIAAVNRMIVGAVDGVRVRQGKR
jgi:hypothetical protein